MTEPTELERAVAQALKSTLSCCMDSYALYPQPQLHGIDAAVRAAIAAIIKAGFAVVPTEPTEEMLNEAEYEEVPSSSDGEDCNLTIRECGIGIPQKVWGAMIAAAPKP